MQDMPIGEPVAFQPATSSIVVEAIKPKGRHFLAVFFLSFMWGTFGVDRIYLGKIPTGILKFLTIGGLGIWTLVDFILIMSGAMTDKQGNPMIGYKEYKKFAARTVLWSAIIIGLYVLISGILTILSITQLVEHFQTSGGASSLKGLVPASTLQSIGIN
jgi:TM2 domain-containing membrane protein YozV